MNEKDNNNSSKKWVIIFVISISIILVFIALLNVVVDPIGIFGDKFYNWYSYDFTNNPRASKIAYLDKHFEEYDSYIIGCSSTSSYSPNTLNKYFNSNFYNLIMYGADLLDVEQTCNYLIENYHPKKEIKNIIVNLHLSNGTKYNEELDNITNNLHANVNGESKIKFYGRYLFLNPRYAFAKIDASKKDTYLTQTFDVFNVSTGAYDKKVRDAESINELSKYYEIYPAFLDYPQYAEPMTKIDETVESLKKIKKMCEDNNINFLVTTSPTYWEHLKHYSRDDIDDFFTKIANVTDFWDFTTNSVCKDPRYFYDETHFRNSVGDMAIAKIFDDKSVYYPDDFGYLVTKDNVKNHLEKLWEYVDSDDYKTDIKDLEKDYTKIVSVLTYHQVIDSANDNVSISPKMFEEHLKTLKDNNYNSILINDLIDYVYTGKELPENPILITFDDGYSSNYEYAYPLLKKYNMKANIFVIGSSVGKNIYKNTSNKITPHFGYDEALEMEQSGLIQIESHTYSMHDWAPFESGNIIHESAVKLEDETESEFIQELRDDFSSLNNDFNKYLSKNVSAISFPNGKTDTLTNVILNELGIKASFTTKEATNTIIKGLPQSLFCLNRFNMYEDIDGELLLKILSNS